MFSISFHYFDYKYNIRVLVFKKIPLKINGNIVSKSSDVSDASI